MPDPSLRANTFFACSRSRLPRAVQSVQREMVASCGQKRHTEQQQLLIARSDASCRGAKPILPTKKFENVIISYFGP